MHIARKSSFETTSEAAFDAQHWYLAQVKPNGFDRAVRNLNRQSFPTFMPMRDTSLRRNGRLIPTMTPLFPGYVFTQVRPENSHWRVINSTYGVPRLVALSDGRPTQVPSELIFLLFERTDENGVMGAPQDLEPGDMVRIIYGPFA